MSTVKAYPCIGGPLAGQYATTRDFEGSSLFLNSIDNGDGEGIYSHLRREYLAYNSNSRGDNSVGGFPPSIVWIHQSVLKPIIAARER